MTAYAAKLVQDYQFGREYLAKIPFDLAIQAAQGTAFLPGFQLPANAVPTGGALYVTTAWDGTTDTVSVGTSGSPASLLAATTLKTVGSTALTLPAVSAQAQTFGLTFAATGTATKGAGVVYLKYFIPCASLGSQGANLEPNL